MDEQGQVWTALAYIAMLFLLCCAGVLVFLIVALAGG
jgi:hypothetical protein